MTEFYKKEDVIAFLNLHCPKDMWEYQIADLPTIKVMEYVDKEQAYMKGYERGRIEGTLTNIPTNTPTIEVVHCKDCKFKRLYDGETKYYYCALEDKPNRNWSVDDWNFCSWAERKE